MTNSGNRCIASGGAVADAYVDIGGNGSFGWDEVMQPDGLADVAADADVVQRLLRRRVSLPIASILSWLTRALVPQLQARLVT